jgi:hypothetical protein
VLKQDLFIGIVSVSAIVYVILFDSSPAGIFPAPASSPGSSVSADASSRTTETRDLTDYSSSPLGPAPSRMLVIGSEGTPTPQARARLIEEVTGWLSRPIPGEFDRLKADYEAISQLNDSLNLFRVALEEPLAKAFQAKMAELKRYYLLQRTTLMLGQVAASYALPASSEADRIERDLARLRELARDVEWVEQRYDFVYPKDRKEYLKQLIEVLESMARL